MASRDDIRVRVYAQDDASSTLKDVAQKADKLDGRQTDVKVNADASGFNDALDQLDGSIGGIGGQLSALASPGGALAAVGAGFVLAADKAATVAIEADNIASLTGDSVEEASRLNAVWKLTGADTKDLQDVLLQMNGVLSTNKDIAKQLGVNLNDGATVGQRFQQVADALDKIPDAAKRSQIASQVFGEEGVRQYNALRQAVGDVGDAMANVAEGQVISEDDVANAREFKAEMAKVKAELDAIITAIGQGVVPKLADMVGGVGDLIKVADQLKLIDIAGEVSGWLNPVKKIGDELRGPATNAVKNAGSAIKSWFGGEAPEAFEATETAAEQYAESLVMLAQQVEREQDAEILATESRYANKRAAEEYVDFLEGRYLQAVEAEIAANERARESARQRAEQIDAVTAAQERQLAAQLQTIGADIGQRDANATAIAAFNDPNLSLDQKLTAILNASREIAGTRETELASRGNRIDENVRAQLLREELSNFASLFGGMVTGDTALGDAIANALNTYVQQIALQMTGGRTGGTVSNGIARFASGGVVGGPKGAPQLAVVHGGEEVLTPEQRAGTGGITLIFQGPVLGSKDAIARFFNDAMTTWVKNGGRTTFTNG